MYFLKLQHDYNIFVLFKKFNTNTILFYNNIRFIFHVCICLNNIFIPTLFYYIFNDLESNQLHTFFELSCFIGFFDLDFHRLSYAKYLIKLTFVESKIYIHFFFFCWVFLDVNSVCFHIIGLKLNILTWMLHKWYGVLVYHIRGPCCNFVPVLVRLDLVF